MKAIVNQDECTGCELCVQTCPEVFEMADDWHLQRLIKFLLMQKKLVDRRSKSVLLNV